MIDTNKYEQILAEGLMLDHYALLVQLRDRQEVLPYGRIQGFLNLLNKKGYIAGGLLTEKAIKLIESEPVKQAPRKEVEFVTPASLKTVNNKTNFADWVIGLHGRLKAELKKLTGKDQVRGVIDGVKQPAFICNVTDLGKKIQYVMINYKVKDLDVVEKLLFRHLKRCAAKKHWFPVLQYYIFKEKVGSRLVDDMQAMEDDDDDTPSINPSIHIV